MRKFYFVFVAMLTFGSIKANVITGNFSICLPGPNTTQLTGSGIPASINPWTSSNPAVATVSNSGLVTAISYGTTTIIYTDNLGNNAAQNVYVSAFPTITSASGASETCIGGLLELTGSAFPNAIDPWMSLDTTIAAVDNTGSVTGVSAGIVNIIYRNLGGCIVAKTITIKPLLSPEISEGTSTSNQISINWAPVAGATTYTVVYRINGGSFMSGGFGSAITYSLNGLSPGDNVEFYVTPAGPVGSCFQSGIRSFSTNVNCNAVNIPTAPILTRMQPSCVDSTGSIVISGVDGSLYSLDGESYSTTLSYNNIPANSGHFVTAKNATGCISNASMATIDSQPSNAATLTLTSSATTKAQSLCQHESIVPVVFTVGNGATGAFLVSGSVPDGVTGSFNQSLGILTLSGIPTQSGTFNYVVATTGGCGSATLTGIIVVYPTLDLIFCDASQAIAPNSIYFDWQTIPGVTSYNYSYAIGAGPIIIGTTSVSYYEVFDVLPGQQVSFTVANNQTGCASSVTATCAPLSIESFQTSAVQYFPNPVHDILNLKFSKPLKRVQIDNILGQQVYAGDFNENEIQINLNNLNKGCYIVKTIMEDTVQSFKIFKN